MATIDRILTDPVKPARWSRHGIVHLARKFWIRSLQVQGQCDIFNVLNASSVLGEVESFGPTWGRPTAILQGRLFAIGAQMTF